MVGAWNNLMPPSHKPQPSFRIERLPGTKSRASGPGVPPGASDFQGRVAEMPLGRPDAAGVPLLVASGVAATARVPAIQDSSFNRSLQCNSDKIKKLRKGLANCQTLKATVGSAWLACPIPPHRTS